MKIVSTCDSLRLIQPLFYVPMKFNVRTSFSVYLVAVYLRREKFTPTIYFKLCVLNRITATESLKIFFNIGLVYLFEDNNKYFY